ncbi:hypothetical protein GCM10010266_70410 [Streptomyces griseomycini]|nr:hypothetical protein GCM10010266_70410 [Streptomyces griseomycini]GGR57232.1 hypothetical protein GCM10015536_72540 [Streptomyces griseomycini]
MVPGGAVRGAGPGGSAPGSVSERFLSSFEGSFHPYGLKVRRAPGEAAPSRLRSPDDEQWPGDPDPYDRRAPGAPGGA